MPRIKYMVLRVCPKCKRFIRRYFGVDRCGCK